MSSIYCLSPTQLFRKISASWTILIFLVTFFPCGAEDKPQIGQIIASVGKVKAVASDKTERSLKRGDPFYPLDVIVVDAASKAQLKFIDGGIINLIAQTEYHIDSYVFNDPNKISEFLSTLVKGGFRAVSGSIAKENPAGTQVRTPLATIGLRGTIYEAVFANRKVSAGCEEGKIAVTNDKGEVEIGPTSNTLYAIVIEGEAPLPSMKMPSDLAAVSFEVEGGEPLRVRTVPAPAVQQPSVQPQTFPLPGPGESYAPPGNYPQEFPREYPESKRYYPSSKDSGAYHDKSKSAGGQQSTTHQEAYQGSGKSYPSSEKSYQDSGKSYQSSGKSYQGSGQYDQSSGKGYQSSGKGYQGSRQPDRSNEQNFQGADQNYQGGSRQYRGESSQDSDRGYPSGRGSYPGGGGGFPLSPFGIDQ